MNKLMKNISNMVMAAGLLTLVSCGSGGSNGSAPNLVETPEGMITECSTLTAGHSCFFSTEDGNLGVSRNDEGDRLTVDGQIFSTSSNEELNIRLKEDANKTLLFIQDNLGIQIHNLFGDESISINDGTTLTEALEIEFVITEDGRLIEKQLVITSAVLTSNVVETSDGVFKSEDQESIIAGVTANQIVKIELLNSGKTASLIIEGSDLTVNSVDQYGTIVIWSAGSKTQEVRDFLNTHGSVETAVHVAE